MPVAVAAPATPPAAPQRPIDELESLAAQTTGRRHAVKGKKKVDYTKEIIIGSVVGAVGVLLFIIYAAISSQDKDPARGLGGVAESVPDKHLESMKKKLSAELKEKAKEIAKEKERKEQEKKEKEALAAHAPAHNGGNGPLKAFGPSRTSQSGDDPADPAIHALRDFGPPSRTMDSPDPGHPAQAPQQGQQGQQGQAAEPFHGRDNLQDLGSENDPVFKTPDPEPPEKKTETPDKK
jgi:hypothetical protein